MSPQEKLTSLTKSLSSATFDALIEYANSRTYLGKTTIINIIHKYISLLESPIRINDSKELSDALVQIRTSLCLSHTLNSVRGMLPELRKFISLLINKKIISDKVIFPDIPKNIKTFQNYQNQYIPSNYISKITLVEPSANDIFNNTLLKTCPKQIAARLKEHVYSFKMFKHHRNPLNHFLNQIYSEHPKWYLYPHVIEGSLIKYRNHLLKKLTRNTAYSQFQNVKNAISVLIDHSLLPKETDLPCNLRRCTQTQKIRLNNPLLCSTDIYDERTKEKVKNSEELIKRVIEDLDDNLNIMLSEARKIVFKGYHKYHSRTQLIRESERENFLCHPELLICKTAKTSDGREWEYQGSPFNTMGRTNQQRTKNLISYFDYYYDAYLKGAAIHNLDGLSYNKDVREHLGMTTRVASAMHIIIVYEMGINPYSLYNIKVQSNGHGHELVQVKSDGSVRVRALKLRARNAKTRNTKVSSDNLIDISEQNIDAAVCLKMALDMTSRIREITHKKELWLCSMKDGVRHPSPEIFQLSFNRIRSNFAKKSTLLEEATLKKVRSSTGILIYLKSNGDSIKTADYFGNTVKTTISRYIPSYLSELIYRLKIRNFQNILLYMAVADHDSPEHSLGLNIKDFTTNITKAFDNPDFGGAVYQRLLQKKSTDESLKTKYFCVSLNNIILALKYAKSGEDPIIKSDCLEVVKKISEGPIMMKQLLRQAQLELDSIEGVENDLHKTKCF